jgi:hypothetical protein
VVNNCATQFFGRLSSPNNIQTAENLLGECGVIAGLRTGQFYTTAKDNDKPKLDISLGLSAHLGPASQPEIIAFAKKP